MLTIKSIDIKSINSYDSLLRMIDNSHIDEEVVSFLKNKVGMKCNRIIIECPYYDRDYLSTFYIFYAKKFKEYDKYCCRLILLCGDDEIIGYISLRPTHKGAKIGKSLIDPRWLIDKPAHIMLEKFKLHFEGTESLIDAFPWMQQERDVAICAHTALWSVITFAKKFRQYPVLTMGEVIERVESNTRKIPSIGLNVQQVSNVLLKCGFSPIIREKNIDGYPLLNECLTYVDSGIPVICTMESIKHAIVMNGYFDIDRKNLNLELVQKSGYVERITADNKREKTDAILHTDLIRSIIVSDDNHFPYKEVPKIENIYQHEFESENGVSYLAGAIDKAIIPLYSRTQLVYNEVLTAFLGINASGLMNWSSPKVIRIFLTSANTYKEYINEMKGGNNDELFDLIMSLNFPRFIWCVEVSSFKNYKQKLIDGMAVIDPTCSTMDDSPFIFLHDSNRIVVREVKKKSRSEDKATDISITPYSTFEKNLVVIV